MAEEEDQEEEERKNEKGKNGGKKGRRFFVCRLSFFTWGGSYLKGAGDDCRSVRGIMSYMPPCKRRFIR